MRTPTAAPTFTSLLLAVACGCGGSPIDTDGGDGTDGGGGGDGGGTPQTHFIDINSDGSFTPDALTIRAGDTVTWRQLGKLDSVIRVPEVGLGVDPCTLAAAYGDVTDEFSGPLRSGLPGIYVRGPGGAGTGGPEIVELPATCDEDLTPIVVGNKQYCSGQIGVPQYLPDEMWDYPELGGELVLIDWREIETADEVYDWTTLEHELTQASQHGKHISLSIKAGQGAIPPWLFTTAGVTPVPIKDNNESHPGPANCGTEWNAGSFADAAYVIEIEEAITAIADHIKSNAAWVEAFGSWQLMGVNNVSGEFKLPTSCLDDFIGEGQTTPGRDGILDTYNGDPCRCNTSAWAAAGYTEDGLYEFVENQVAFVHDAFGSHLTIKYPLIHGGLPKVENATNFDGDTLLMQDGTTPVCSACSSGDDNQLPGAIQQVEGIIARGHAAAGDRFAVMHFGLGSYPTEDPSSPAPQNCTWGGAVDALAVPPAVVFPIPMVGPVNQEPQCPNSWAVSAGITPPTSHYTGFQTNNAQNGIDSPARLESALWNLTRNSAAVYLEFYAAQVWQNHEINGADGKMDAARETPNNPAVDDEVAFSKSMRQWAAELLARRESFPDDPYPESLSQTFTVGGITHYFYNARTCGDAIGKSAHIVVE